MKMPHSIDDQKVIKRLKRIQEQLNFMCDFVKEKSVNEIVSHNHFWHALQNYCDTLPDYVCIRNYDFYKSIIQEWINLLQLIISKDDTLKAILLNGPLKSVLKELLNVDKKYPNWFIKTFFNSLFVYFQFGENILPRFFKVVWDAISYSSQEAFLFGIISNFDHDSIYKYIQRNCINKELQQLFNFIFDNNGHQQSIRNFLNYLNLYENPGKIFSFISSNIKLNSFLLVQNAWVDLNMRSNTITFSAKKSDLSREEESPYFKHNLEEDCDEFDVITIKISHVGYVRFKRLDDNEDELSFELNHPLTALYESSDEFLKNFRVVSIYFAANNERLKAFIFEYFRKKAEVSICNLNQNNYELELVHSDSSDDSFDLSVTDTAHSTQSLPIVEEVDNSLDDDEELDENLIIDGSGNDYKKCNSTILQTPEPPTSTNISVDESTAPNSDDSICSDSVSSSYEITHYKSIFATPVPESTNVSVAASYDTPDIPRPEDSGIDSQENRTSGGIRVRTPAIINELPIEVIDLTSPEVSNKDKYEQSEKINDIENIEPVIPAPELKEICQNHVAQPNIVEIPKSISKTRISNVSDVSEASEVSEQNDQENLEQNEDNQQLLNSSYVSQGTQVSIGSRTSRKTRKRKIKYDDKAEYAETSFFSDKETAENIYIRTKTRVVRKHRPFQYNSDAGTNPRRSRKKNKKYVSEAEFTDVDVPPPVKRIKILLPVRSSITNTSTAEVFPETLNTTVGKNENKMKRIMSDINAVEHLVEEPTEQTFGISVTKNTENAGQKEEIQSNNTTKKLDDFDKMLLNIHSQKSPQKNLQFFSSLSSQNTPDYQTNNIQNGQLQNVEKYLELMSKNIPDSSQNSIEQKQPKRKNAQKVSSVAKKNENIKKTSAEKVTKRTKKDLIEEVQNGSGDHQLLRNYAETNQISFEQAFRQLMPKIESDIQNICEGWTMYASESDKNIFKNNMKKYFS